ncbi:MAG: MmcQ/YjbR family DNA-binding protein, partial [Candidatus Saccharimonadales bacterium]
LPGAKLDYPFGIETAVYKVFVPSISSDTHLDAAQGSSEERMKRRDATLSERKSVTDTAMRREPAGAAGSAGRQGKAVRGDWKMFALIAEKSQPLRLSLKCDPLLAEILRDKYETVLPGYHLNKKHWNTVILTGQLSWEKIQDLIRHSYELVTKTAEQKV